MKEAYALARRTSPCNGLQLVLRIPGLYLDAYEHILASAADVPYSGPETYLFVCDQEGEVLDWLELPGSQKGILDVGRVLIDAGLRVTRFDASIFEGDSGVTRFDPSIFEGDSE